MEKKEQLFIVLQLVILAFQLFIYWRQLELTKKIENNHNSSQKGYFIITDNNMPLHPELVTKLKHHYDMRNPFTFKNIGNDIIILELYKITINKRIDNQTIVSNNIFFGTNEFNIWGVELDLKDKELNMDKIEVDIDLQLKNSIGYKYKQTINMEFIKDEMSKPYWWLNKYNMKFN